MVSKPTIGLFALVSIIATPAWATEICGNDIDDDGNGMTDEGCAPSLTSEICESPLSCIETGMVSWSSGGLHYELPPDVAPKVPYGPGIGFRRFYTSMSTPGANPTSVNKKPLGDHWQHTYLTYLHQYVSGDHVRVVLHTNDGRDVLFTFSGSDGTWESYTPQAGFHVLSLKHRVASPNEYQLQLLTGETLVYNSVGQISEIWDTLGPTPNKVLITWDSTTNGNVSTVTDANGKRRLLFSYTNGLMSSVQFQTFQSTWTTRHTTTYDYSGGVSRDATSGWFVPANTSEWTNLLSGSGIASPSSLWLAQEASGNLADSIGSAPGTVTGATYQVSASGWSRKGIKITTDGGTGKITVPSPNASTTSLLMAQVFSLNTNPATGYRGLNCLGATQYEEAELVNGPKMRGQSGSNLHTSASNRSGTILVVTKLDHGRSEFALYTDAGDVLKPTFQNQSADTFSYLLGDGVSSSDATLLYASMFTGSAAELSDAQVTTLINRLKTGPGLSGVTIGGQLAQKMVYDANGLLTKITDASNNQIATFGYSSTVAGQTNFVATPRGTVGFEFNSSRTGCTGKTALYFNKASAVTCQTFDAARGYLSRRREAMAGQTDCTTTNGADITTNWARDSALRITQLTRPDGSCMFWEYDSSGRLARTKRRDDCNPASSGDREEYLYNSEGLLYEIDTYDASSTITHKQLMSYFASRRLAAVTNPVDITKSTNLLYDAGGMVNEVDGAGGLSKTTYTINADRRVTAETRYKDSVNSDTWQLLFDWLGNQSKVTDGDSKATQTVRDDLGRIVKIVSPDTSYPTLRVYDAASRLKTVVEAFGSGAAEQTHTFTFDALSRPLNDEYSGACPTGTAHAEIMRSYDAPAETCPTNTANHCANAVGHLAWVSATLLCSSSYTDGTLDQKSWYAYDGAGRMTEEYIIDDAGRNAENMFVWTKNGALTRYIPPSTVPMQWDFGSSSSNSDTDRVTQVSRTSAANPVIDTVKWFPYGPLQQYNWEATYSGAGLLTYITRNLAYRITYVGNAELSTLSGALDAVTITEDAKGRVTARDYTPSDPTFAGLFDSYFLYDQQDRVTCETTTFQATCPTSGSGLKNQLKDFTAAGDWGKLLRAVPGSTGFMNQFTLGTGTHQITAISQNDGTPVLGDTIMAYDERGNRKYDDNTSTLTHDRRDYTYDARKNVINVRGEYKTGGAWHFYDVASAFDARNRRVYKSFFDETLLKTATWFFYYDAFDRLTEIWYTPDSSAPSTYSVFQLFWLDDRITLFWQTDYPSATTSKRYVASDETGRVIKLWTWPSSGSTTNVWAVNGTAWGVDTTLVGSTIFQPTLFKAQYSDSDTSAWINDGVTVHRPGLALDGYRSYDRVSGSLLQCDKDFTPRSQSYVFAGSSPLGGSALGLEPDGNPMRTQRNDPSPKVFLANDDAPSAAATSDNGDGNDGLPPPGEAPITFPGDRYSGLSGCFPTSRFDRQLCAACLADGSLRCGGVGGCYWQCLFNGICQSTDIDFLNIYKHDVCGGPDNNYVCEVHCDGFHPHFRDHHSGIVDRPELLAQ